MRATPNAPPAKANAWTTAGWGKRRNASAAPSPAPELTPSSRPSTRGLRNTPWYTAPATARFAPTNAAAPIRGRRIRRTSAWTTGSTPARGGTTKNRLTSSTRSGNAQAGLTISGTRMRPTTTHSPTWATPSSRACPITAHTSPGAIGYRPTMRAKNITGRGRRRSPPTSTDRFIGRTGPLPHPG